MQLILLLLGIAILIISGPIGWAISGLLIIMLVLDII
jgi:hypothetical protein